VVGAEQRGKGANIVLGPTGNIVRDPRWGRAFETYGEDPVLQSAIGVGYIDGVQGQDRRTTAKTHEPNQPDIVEIAAVGINGAGSGRAEHKGPRRCRGRPDELPPAGLRSARRLIAAGGGPIVERNGGRDR